MSRVTGEQLYHRLPEAYRTADTTSGGVVRALLDLIASEADRIGAQIDELADAWFIETAPEWAVSYIGDLLGVPLTRITGADTAGVVTQRALVANTIRYRRRKGTASVLESLAFDTTGWRSVAIEEFERLQTTQHLAHPRVALPNTVDLRNGEQLEATPGPWSVHAHTVDVHTVGIDRPDGASRPNVPNVTIHSYRVDGLWIPMATAQPADAPGRYRFDLLGRDVALANPPVHDPGVDVRTSEDEVPAMLRRRRLREQLDARRTAAAVGDPDPSPRWATRPPLQVFLVPNAGDDPVAVDALRLRSCHLDPWKPAHPSGDIRFDPVLGRLVVPDPQPFAVLVSATPGGIPGVGAGPQPRLAIRDVVADAGVTWQRGVSRDHAPVTGQLCATLSQAVAEWNTAPVGSIGVIALMDNHRHDVSLIDTNALRIPASSHLTIVAADWPELPVAGGAPGERARQLGAITPERLQPAIVGDIEILGGAPADSLVPGSFRLDGVVLDGDLRVVGNAAEQLGALLLTGCTHVGGSLSAAGPRQLLDVRITTSRVGNVTLDHTADRLRIAETVVAGEVDAPGANAQLEAVTVLGTTSLRRLEATDCIFDATVKVARQQTGCVRYSYITPGSTVPRQYCCVTAPKPVFVSRERDHRSLAVLVPDGPSPLRGASSTGGEVGAYAGIEQSQREQNMRIALREYLRVGIGAALAPRVR